MNLSRARAPSVLHVATVQRRPATAMGCSISSDMAWHARAAAACASVLELQFLGTWLHSSPSAKRGRVIARCVKAAPSPEYRSVSVPPLLLLSPGGTASSRPCSTPCHSAPCSFRMSAPESGSQPPLSLSCEACRATQPASSWAKQGAARPTAAHQAHIATNTVFLLLPPPCEPAVCAMLLPRPPPPSPPPLPPPPSAPAAPTAAPAGAALPALSSTTAKWT